MVCAGLAFATLPGAAYAGMATDAQAASFDVVSMCSVDGGEVVLGTYLVSQTWGDVAADMGDNLGNAVIVGGARGVEYVNWGTVTCTENLKYDLYIKGTGTESPGAIRLAVGSKKAVFNAMVKSIGDQVQENNAWSSPNGGAFVGGGGKPPAKGIGTGKVQEIKGSVHFQRAFSTVAVTDPLPLGVYTDTLSYQLNF